MGETREHVMNFKVSTEEMEMIRRGAAAKEDRPLPNIVARVFIGIEPLKETSTLSRGSRKISPNFVKSVPGNIKKIVEELVAPRKDARKALAYVSGERTRGK